MRARGRLLTLAMLALAQMGFAEDSGKKVFAHYMVCIPTHGGDSKIEDYQREIRAAQPAADAVRRGHHVSLFYAYVRAQRLESL